MTEQQVSVTSTEHDAAPPHPGPPDLSHPTSAEMAEAVASTEELNEADEVYATEVAALDEADAAEPAAAESADAAAADVEPAVEADPVAESSPEVQESPGAVDTVDEAVELELSEAVGADSIDEVGAAAEPVEPVVSADPGADELVASAEPTADESPAVAEPPAVEQPAEAAAEPAADEPTTEAAQTAAEPAADEPTTEAAPTTAEAQPAEAPADASPAADHDLIPVPELTPGLTLSGPARPSAPRQRPGGGKPGGPRRPTPVPRPVGAAPNAAAPAVPTPELVETSDPSPWGRVDASGAVYVSTADGEREVGFWQAGDPAAGLAHYGRRFDDFMTEIVVLETRLANHSGDPKAARTHAQMLRQSVDTLPAVGDLATAAARLDAVLAAADQAVVDSAKDRATAKAAAVGRREALCEEAEALAESSQWKASGDRLKEIVEEWRTIRGIDRKTDDLLWKRFSKARDTFIRRRGSHFAEMDKERGAAKGVKETLIERAEKLSESTEWAATATEYRNLMAEWKAAGRTSRDVEDALWDRFRAAQEKFFSRRQETFASRDAEFEGNAAVKEALLVEAEKINPAAGLDAAKAALRSIQDRWEAAGKVPRERIRTLDARLRAVEDKVKSAEDSLWRKTDPETSARLAQFRSRYEAYQQQADKATASGDAKRASAAQAQANQWLEWLRAAENAVD